MRVEKLEEGTAALALSIEEAYLLLTDLIEDMALCILENMRVAEYIRSGRTVSLFFFM